MLVQIMYGNARSKVRVGVVVSQEFSEKVGVHQASCLSPLLFIIMMEALSWEFRPRCPWDDMYADDLVIISKSLVELHENILLWKAGMEAN